LPLEELHATSVATPPEANKVNTKSRMTLSSSAPEAG
jgi:hypothetical protein